MKSANLYWSAGPGMTIALRMEIATEKGVWVATQYATTWPGCLEPRHGGVSDAVLRPRHDAKSAGESIRNAVMFLKVQALHALSDARRRLDVDDPLAAALIGQAWGEIAHDIGATL